MTAAALKFSGRLAAVKVSPVAGLHQLALYLVDDDGSPHVAYQCFGRGDAAQAAADAARAELQIGCRYHGSATVEHVGTLATYWCGDVTLARDARRVHEPVVAAQCLQGAA